MSTTIESGFGRLTSRFESNGSPLPFEGKVYLRQVQVSIIDEVDQSITLPATITAWVDAQGYLCDAKPVAGLEVNRFIDLLAIPDATYQASFVISQGGVPIYVPSFRFKIVAGVIQNLMDLVPLNQDGTPAESGTYVTGLSVANGVLVVAFSDGTTQNIAGLGGGTGTGGGGVDGRGITSTNVVAGKLIVTYSDGTTHDAGNVVGPAGESTPGTPGVDGTDGRGIASTDVVGGELVVTYTDASTVNLGNVTGPQGVGVDGRGITSTEVVGDNLLVTYTDGEAVTVGPVKGAPGVGIASVNVSSGNYLMITYTDGSSAEVGPITGGGGEPVQDTGAWLYYSYTKGEKIVIRRTGNEVKVQVKMRMQAMYEPWYVLNLSGNGVGVGFTTNTFLSVFASGNSGLVQAEMSFFANDGQVMIYANNLKPDPDDVQYNKFGEIYAQWTYNSFDPFPTNMATCLPGFTLMTNISVWQGVY